MKQRSSVLLVVAGIALGGGAFWWVNADSDSESSVSISAEGQAATEERLADASKEVSEKSESKPQIYFLDEAGAPAADSRPRANMMPKANGTRRITEVRPITTPEEGDFMAPRWSPDGLELMFSSAGYSGLYTRGINGGGITQITGKDHIGHGAEWTKDGKIIAKNNNGERQEFNPDGTPASSVDPVLDSNITGAFNSDDVVYYRENPGEAPVPVSAGEDRYYGGVVSDDGKYIAYNGIETGIYVAPTDGSAPPVHIGYGENPSFLPDGSGIVYTVTQDDGHNLVAGDLYLSSLDGQNVSNLTDGSPMIETKPAVSPDGQRIAFEADGQIYIGSLQ